MTKMKGLAVVLAVFLLGDILLAQAANPKIVYVSPDGTGGGSSWSDASGSIADAYVSAAAFADSGFDSGEVWIKTGRYKVATPITIKSHVTVRGGFFGNETDAAQADAKENLTLLTGDRGDDDFWKPENVDPGAGNRVPIWSGADLMTYNPPNPERKDNRWVPWRTDAHAYDGAFYGSDSLVEDCRFFGVTFTGFRYAAIKMGIWVPKSGTVAAHADESSVGRGFVISNCTFLAHATSGGDTINNGAIQMINTDVRVEDCVFDGNWSSLTIRSGATPITNVVRRCVFSNGSGPQVGFYDGNEQNAWFVENCDFWRNYNDSVSYGLVEFYQLNDLHRMVYLVKDCTIRENRLGVKGISLFGAVGSYGAAWHQFQGCDFVSNTVLSTVTSAYVAPCVWGGANTTRWYFRGCSFRSNSVQDYNVAEGNAASVYGSATANNYAYFIDCTLVSNSIHAAEGAAPGQLGTLTLGTAATRLLISGSVLKDNEAVGAATRARADLALMGPDNKNGAVNIVNSIIYGSDSDYIPLRCNEVVPAYIHDCYISKFNVETMCPAAQRYENVWTTGDPRFTQMKKGPFAAFAIGLSHESPYAKAGSPTWMSPWDNTRTTVNAKGETVADTDHYIWELEYTPGFLKNKPWKEIFGAWSGGLTDADAAGKYGISIDEPLMTDAFGKARKFGKVSLGPLAYDEPGLMLILR